MKWLDSIKFKVSDHFSDERKMLEIFLNQMNTFYTSGCKFITDTSSSGEQVKHIGIFKIYSVYQDIENSFPGKIGGWPGAKPWWGVDPLTSIFTAYYAQLAELKIFIKLKRSTSFIT